MDPLRLEVLQFAPAFAEPARNLERIRAQVESRSADLLLTPELSVTGYDMGDDAAHLAHELAVGGTFPAAAWSGETVALLGLPERRDDGLTYNSLVAVQGGRVLFRHRKIYRPTYGMFDEGRHWAAGRDIDVWSHGDWRIGLLICEDLWHPALAWVLATRGIHMLLVAAAAPGRGVRPRDADLELLGAEPAAALAFGGAVGPEAASPFASAAKWERLARVTAEVYGIHVALANRTGVEGGVTFAGGSLVVGPDGRVISRAPATGDAILHVEVSLEAVHRARRPFAHARDDDRDLVLRALAAP